MSCLVIAALVAPLTKTVEWTALGKRQQIVVEAPKWVFADSDFMIALPIEGSHWDQKIEEDVRPDANESSDEYLLSAATRK